LFLFKKWILLQHSGSLSPCYSQFTCTYGDHKKECGSLDWAANELSTVNIDWHLSDEAAFLSQLESETGINPKWISFSDKLIALRKDMTYYRSGFPILGSGGPKITYSHYPVLMEHYDVPDPREIFKKIAPKAGGLRQRMENTYVEMMLGYYDEPDKDALHVYSVPVFMLQQALKNIEDVKKIGKEARSKERTDFILELVGDAFAIIPFVGQISAATAGLVKLG
jgi:hypothetical protein